MSVTPTRVGLEPVGEVPETASVCHFDELEGPLQEAVVSACLRGEGAEFEAHCESGQIDDCPCDIVKFTDYYRVDVG
jgi:hypothetical protein